MVDVAEGVNIVTPTANPLLSGAVKAGTAQERR